MLALPFLIGWLGIALPATAANPPAVQTYYVPLPENQLLAMFQQINLATNDTASSSPITSNISISPIANQTIIYYDHYEDGYEADITNPLQTSTQIWGDGKISNGARPGVTTDAGDVINSGGVFVLTNNVATTTGAITVTSPYQFNGRDKIATSKTVAISRVNWATGSTTNMTQATVVYDTSNWGTNFRSPVGQDSASSYLMFKYAAFSIMAGKGGATINVDWDNNGTTDYTQTLVEGQSYVTPIGASGATSLRVGARVTSDKPVQVNLLTGDIENSDFKESRDAGLLPVNLWSNEYYTPVSTQNGSNTTPTTRVWLYNPGASALTVTYANRGTGGTGAITSPTISVPAGGSTNVTIPVGTGARLSASSNFYAFSTTDSVNPSVSTPNTANSSYDWGYAVNPSNTLTSQFLVGFAKGKNPNDTAADENSAPVWVSPVGNGETAVTVYVDLKADGIGASTDPNGNKYDLSYSLKELQQAKIYDNTTPASGQDQTGMLVYVLPGVGGTPSATKLTGAWGEDPRTASLASPGLDAGTGMVPAPLFDIGKSSTLVVDTDGNGQISPGDTMEYNIRINNTGRAVISNLKLVDNVPVDTTYVAGTTKYNVNGGSSFAIADTGGALPLAGTGYTFPVSLPIGGYYEVTFRVVLDSVANFTVGSTSVTNTATGSVAGNSITAVDVRSILAAVNHNYQTFSGVAVNGNASTLNIYPPGSTFSATSSPANGAISNFNPATGTYTYTPTAGYTGTDSFTYRVCMPSPQTTNCATATETITIVAGTPVTLSGTVFEDWNLNKVQNGSEPLTNSGTANALWVTATNVATGQVISTVAVGSGGAFSLSVAQNITYSLVLSTSANSTVPTLPSAWVRTGENQNGTVDSNANGEIIVAVTSSNVTAQNFGIVSPPVAVNDSATTAYNTSVNLSILTNDFQGATGTTFNNATIDLDPSTAGVQTSYTVAGQGTFTVNTSTGIVTFTPVSGFSGVVTPISYTVSDNHGVASNAATIAVTVGAQPSADLVVVKTDGATSVNAGDTTTYTITVTNNGPNEVTAATVVDTPPTGLTIGTWTCAVTNAGSGGSVTTACGSASGSSSLNTTVTLKNGAIITYTVNATVAGSATGSVVNSVTVNPPNGTNDPVPGNNTATDTNTVTPVANLGIAKTDNVGTVNAGGSTTYTITVTNAGPSEVAGATVVDTAPSGLTIGSWTCAVGNAGSGGTVTTACGAASGSGNLSSTVTMKNGASIIYTVTAAVAGSASGSLINSVTVTPPSGTTDPTPGNNTATDTDTVTPVADLAVTKTNGVSSVNTGGSSTYTITVTNIGPSEVAAATVVDAPPAGLNFISWSCAVTNVGSGGTVTTACGTASGSGGLNTTVTMKSGAVITYTVNTTVDGTASGSLANSVTVGVPGGTTDPASGNNTATDTDTVVQTSSIGDYVWYDTNHDGIQQPEERGIAGVTVNVYDSTGSNVIKSTQTDGSGFYTLAGLTAGSYVVEFLPRPAAGLTPSPANHGTGTLADSFDSDADVTTGRVTVTLQAGVSNVTVDAGFYRPETNPANIGDYVWYDTNHDGIQDAGEKGLGGVTVNLTKAGTTGTWASTKTDGNGFYEFAGLPVGDYTVEFVTPSGYTRSPQTAQSVPNPSTGLTSTLTLTAGQTLTTIDAGMFLTGTAAGTSAASIGNFVWNDTNGDGIQTGNEPGIPGVVINLYNSTGTTLIESTQTDATGAYVFNGLAAGDYVVEFVKPNSSYVFSPTGAGTPSTDSNANQTTGRASITLTAGQASIDMDAGLRIAGTPDPIDIGDFVWLDANGNRLPNESEGLANAVVVLYDSLGNELVRTTTTATTSTANNYNFTGLGNGSYRVQVVSTSLPSSAIEIAERTGDTTYDNMTDLLALTATVTNADFGYITAAPAITIVKKATNGTDTQNVLEPGIAYFSITVTNTGNLSLTQVMVTDPFASACVKTVGTLAPGAHTTYTCAKDSAGGSVGAPGASWTNRADVNGQPVDSNGNAILSAVTNFDTSAVVVVHPAITIAKTANPTSINTGSAASFEIVVTNSGDVALTGVAVTDTLAPNCDHTTGNLAVGATASYTCTLANVTSAITNVAVATGTATSTSSPTDATPPSTKTVTASDDASVAVTTPGMTITKTTSTPVVRQGGTVTYTIRVTNTGQSALSGVEVTDAQAPLCNRTAGNAIGPIAVNGYSEYTCTQIAGSASFTNTAEADSNETPVASASVNVTVIHPSVSIDKKTNDDFPAEPVSLHQGSLVSWIYTVTNTSADSALTGVTVTDTDTSILVSCPKTTLAALESVTCFGYGPAILGPYTNTGSVTATPPVGDVVTASEGSSYVGYNLAKIGNTVWLDENGNGIHDAGEAGIANQKVELKDSTGTNTLQTTYTDANGGYLFTINQQATGSTTYKIVVTPTSGLNPTYDENGIGTANETNVIVATGGVHLTADFGYNWVTPADSTSPAINATGAIGDRIWNDANGDGLQDPGEAGIGGVTVTLTGAGTDGIFGNAGDSTATTTTNAAGNYIFDGLPAGVYKVTVTPPAPPALPTGLTWTQTGDPDGIVKDNKTTTPIVLAPGDVYVNADFGYQLSQGSSIGDTIWFDADADKAQDIDEPGIAGVTVALRDSNGNTIATTITDANGKYQFTGLPKGTYTVVVDDTNNLLGLLQLSYDPDVNKDSQSPVTVDGASNYFTLNFGYTAFGEHKNFDEDDGVIGDTIYLDRNGDSNFDVGEGLQGVTVELRDNATGALRATTSTNANGTYSFGRLSINDAYKVVVITSTLPNGGVGLTNTVDPDGGTASQATVPVLNTTGGANLGQDFGYRAITSPASIGGTLWDDSNADGIYNSNDSGPPLGDITIALFDGNGNHIASTKSDANGNYLFAGLPASVGGTNYVVVVTDEHNELEGWWHSVGDQSPTANNQSKISPYTVSVTPGVVNLNIDFGYYLMPSSLGNRVWNDANGNGIQDPTETGLAGVDVQVIITYPNNATTKVVSTSDATGFYGFGNLLLDESFNGIATTGQPTYSLSVLAPPTGYLGTLIGAGNYKTDSNNPAGTSVEAGAAGFVVKGQENLTMNAANPNAESDEASYDFGYVSNTAASVTIKAYTNGQDADSVTGPYIKVGDAVTWTYAVNNPGTVALNTLVVVDSHAPGVVPAPVLASGYNVGDLNADNLLDPAETWLYQATGTATSGQYANTGSVSAKSPNLSVVSDSDDSHYYGAVPVITINKVTNTDGGNGGSDGSSIVAGMPVTWVYTVTNTGSNVALGSISVTDDKGVTPVYQSGDTNSNVQLDSGETWIYKATGTATVGAYSNTGSVSGQALDNNGLAVINPTTGSPIDLTRSSDTSGYTGTEPTQLQIRKAVSTASPPLGSAFTYTLTLTNTGGDSTQTVQVTDYVPVGINLVGMTVPSGWTCNPAAISPSQPLSGGNNLVCQKTTGVVVGNSTTTFTLTAIATTTDNVFNAATVSGDIDTPPVNPDASNCTGTAAANCDRTGITGIKPRIDLSKQVILSDETGTPDGLAKAGEKLTYTFTLTNSGDAMLSGIALSDMQLDSGSLSCNALTQQNNPFSLTVPADNKLAPGDFVICTGKHTVTSTEATEGRIDNTSTVVGYSPDVTAELPNGTPWQSSASGVWQNPPPAYLPLLGQIELTKTAVHNDANTNGVFDQGETVTYGFIVRNVGTLSLSNIAVTDPLLAGSTITCQANTLAVNATTTCSVTPAYILTTVDVTAGKLANAARVSATDSNGKTVTDTDSKLLSSGQTAGLSLKKTAVAPAGLAAGDQMAYTLVATNTGAVALTHVLVSDTNLGGLTGNACLPAQDSTLAPGAQMVCTGTYTVTAGEDSPINNLATVTGQPDGRSSPISATSNHVEPYNQVAPVTLYTVGNLIWKDTNNNGIYEASLGETGIDNVLVRLLRCDASGANCVQAVQADGSTLIPDMQTANGGIYQFSSVPETTAGYATYKVQVLPVNFMIDGTGARALYGSSSSSVDAANCDIYGRDLGFGVTPSSVDGILSKPINLLSAAAVVASNIDFGFVFKPIAVAPDLQIVQTATTTTPSKASNNLGFYYTASNVGTGNLTKVPTISNKLLAGMKKTGTITGTNWNCNASTATQIICTYTGTLPIANGVQIGGQIYVPIDLSTAVVGPVTNTALITKITGEPSLTNNSAAVTVTIGN